MVMVKRNQFWLERDWFTNHSPWRQSRTFWYTHPSKPLRLCSSITMSSYFDDRKRSLVRKKQAYNKPGFIFLFFNSTFSHASIVAPGMATLSCLSVGPSVHYFCPDWNVSATVWEIAMKFCTDIHGPQKMNPTDYKVDIFVFLVKCLD